MINTTPPTTSNSAQNNRRLRLPRLRRRSSPSTSPEAAMSIIGHLKELRDRLVKAALSVGITTVLAFVFVEQLVAIFVDQKPAGATLQVLTPAEIFTSYFQVAFTFGLALSMPLILYQLFRFLSPGLMPNERRLIIFSIPIVMLFFISGVLFCYYLLLPPAIDFLYSFGNIEIERAYRLSYYIDFVTKFVLAAGLAFQLPPVIFMLAKLGIVTAKKLAGFRRYAIVLAFVAGAIITPTVDPFNLAMLSIPIYLLFELGVFAARWA